MNDKRAVDLITAIWSITEQLQKMNGHLEWIDHRLASVAEKLDDIAEMQQP